MRILTVRAALDVPDGPCLARLDSKPIRVQTSAHTVETAVLHIMEGTANASELRVSAMHEVNPLHTFMFSGRGKLLNANKAALEACKLSGLTFTGTQGLTMKMLFDAGDYPGGKEEAEAACDEALHAIFVLQLERHRHTQPYISKKDGRSKWAMIEMSPVLDPVDKKPAVLVQRYNISQQKQLELQLHLQQEALQRHNQELEQDALATEQEKAKLQQEADSLAEQLEAVLHDKFATTSTGFDADTPIDKTMKFLQSIIMELSIDEGKFCAFARRIEAGYNPSNPYHNSVHVASVVQMTHMLMCHGGVLASQALTQRQQMATYFSALVHDFEHGGVNNDFLIKTSHPLAITYNDQSPLENHHHAAAVRVQVQPEHRYIPLITQRLLEDQAEIRSMCISQVLGTDMKKHFDITSRFQAAFKRPGGNEGTTSQGAGPAAPRCGVDWDGVKAEDKTLVHQMVLKCADIGHLAAPPRTHRRWAFQLEEEFFRQVTPPC
ncbi:hypothetical protein WJX77_011595 [Trebouxia sp. C0004]